MALLQIDDVSVRFGGVAALNRVTLDADEGAVTGLIGPNGAGKTTLFNVICGLQSPTEGQVIFDGQDITRLKPHHRARLGIGRTFQKLEIFGSLTVRENQLVAAEARQRWVWDGSEPRAVAEHALNTIGLKEVADERADSLSTGLMRLVEFGRALAAKPRLLLLDEVSSGLSDEEAQEIADLMRELAAEGLGILLVGHDMELVMEVCTRVHVLEFGKIIAAGTPKEVQANAAVREAYLGTAEVEEAS